MDCRVKPGNDLLRYGALLVSTVSEMQQLLTKRIRARKILIIVARSKAVGAPAQALSITTSNFKSRNRVSRGAGCRPFDR